MKRGDAKRAHVMVVEDDPKVQALVARCLDEQTYVVMPAASGADAFALCDRERFDLAIVDLRLPDVDGILLVRHFSARLNIPVLVLSGLGAPLQRVEGLEAGADDYLAKPFEPRELAARVGAILRAREQAARQPGVSAPQRLRIENWIADLRRHTLVDATGRQVELSDAEFKLFKVLVDRPNQVVSRQEILAATHEKRETATVRSVDIQITRLRKKLEGDANRPKLIRTVRNAGYMLVADRIEPV